MGLKWAGWRPLSPQAQSLPRRPPVGLVLPAEEALGVACCEGASPSPSGEIPLPTLVCQCLFQAGMVWVPLAASSAVPPYLAEGTPLAGGQGRVAPGGMSPAGTARTGGGHSSVVSRILQLSQIKINFLGLPGIFTAILTPAKGRSSTLTPRPSSQWWQQPRLFRRSDRFSSAGRKL